MNILLIAAFVFAALEALAVSKNWLRLEYIAKPAVMLALFFWLWTSAGLNGALLWFGLGLFLSLVGDVLLMISPDRLFLAGLAAFLLAHVAYVIGFNIPVPEMSVWGIALAVIIGVGGARVIRRIMDALTAQGQGRMRMPILVYSIAISLMILSALLKLTDVKWEAGAALLVSLGAILFYISDIILAWNKFVAPIQHGRIYNIAAYHLGQIALIAGVVAQYSI
ncbi:MAG: lysoplasmalogenase [Anaerolineales bacterium]|nr:lysoplasmalogenase [Anaerolineales bacterium]